MFEELYAPLPSVGEYLSRIGLTETPELSPEGLDRLIVAHQRTVPFENYQICRENRSIDIGIEALFDKIVRRRRGGYCFELNGIIYALMTALGFEAYPVLARIHNNMSTHFAPLHRGNIVRLNGERYFTDVGYGGPMPAGIIKLEDGTVQKKPNGEYKFRKDDNCVWTICRLENGQWSDMMSFSEHPSDIVDFVAPNYYCSDHPNSFFRMARMANIYYEDGFASLMNDELKLVHGDNVTVLKLENEKAETEALKKYFSIEL